MQYEEFYNEINQLWSLRDSIFPVKDSYYFRAFNRRRNDILFKLINPSAGDKILDIGCGSGEMLLSLDNPSATRVGLDISFHRVSQASERSQELQNIHFVIGDSLSLPFGDGQFTKILCSHTIEHLPNPMQLIAEVYRVLKLGGKAVFLTPNASRTCYNSKLKPIFTALLYLVSAVLALITLPSIKGKFSLARKIRNHRKISRKYKEVCKRFGVKEHVHEFTVPELKSLFEDSNFHVSKPLFMGFHSGLGPIIGIELYVNDLFGKLWNNLAIFLEKRASIRLKERLLVDFLLPTEKGQNIETEHT